MVLMEYQEMMVHLVLGEMMETQALLDLPESQEHLPSFPWLGCLQVHCFMYTLLMGPAFSIHTFVYVYVRRMEVAKALLLFQLLETEATEDHLDLLDHRYIYNANVVY